VTAHIWSSQLEMGLATVSSTAPLSEFNETAGVVLNEVQYLPWGTHATISILNLPLVLTRKIFVPRSRYSTLSLRGTGTHTDKSFSVVA
jgi:hypothetical protein